MPSVLKEVLVGVGVVGKRCELGQPVSTDLVGNGHSRALLGDEMRFHPTSGQLAYGLEGQHGTRCAGHPYYDPFDHFCAEPVGCGKSSAQRSETLSTM